MRGGSHTARWALVALVVSAGVASSARAGGAAGPTSQAPHEDPGRTWRGDLLVGGYAAVTGPADYGLDGVLTVKPGGVFGRFGVRAHVRSNETHHRGYGALGVSYEAAATRPRLVIDLAAEAGATDGGTVVTGGAVHTLLVVVGPLTLGADLGAHVFWRGVDSQLALSGAVLLGLSR